MGGTHASCAPDKAGHIVVVGGGYAGVELAVHLKKWGVKYTVIDKQDCWHHNIASPRALVNAECLRNMFIPLNEAFGENFIHAKVVDVDTAGKKVILSDDRQIDYDTLVMCTGPKLGFPARADFSTKAEGIEVFTQYMEKIKASKRILVVGGGPVGVEMAAEIAEAHPDKEVTVIHSSNMLCHPDSNQKFQKKIHKMVTDLGVKLLLDERVTNLEDLRQDGEVTAVTEKGTSVTADMAIICIGGSSRERDAFGSSLASAMNERGSLNVNEFFQVDGHDDVFAIGDCTSVPETKLAVYASANAEHLAANLKRRVEKKPMKPYKPNNAPVMMAVSVGTKHGVIQLNNGFILPEFIIKKAKCKDMSTQRFYDKAGVKLPK